MITLDANGLSVPTRAELRDELVARLRGRFGVNLDVDPTSTIMGQLVEEMTELRALDHQALLACYRSFDPNGAEGRALDARLTLTGSTRKGATRSQVTGILTFSDSGTMNTGDLVRNTDNDSLWRLVDGPKTIVGAGTLAATMEAVETGPTLAQAGTTWEAVTVVANLDGFTNPTDDAQPGSYLETDAEARRRRLVELYTQGQGPLATIAGVVSRIEGVKSNGVRVYHNPSTSPADADGIPFKAFNVVVETTPNPPGADLQQAIAEAIWTTVGAGGEAYGTDYTITIVDSEGFNQLVSFDVVDVVDLVVTLDLVTSTSEDPVTPNLIAIVTDYVLEQAAEAVAVTGRDVRALDFAGMVHDLLQAGTISGVDGVNVEMALSPSSPAAVAKLAIGIRQKPDLDSANLTVTTS